MVVAQLGYNGCVVVEWQSLIEGDAGQVTSTLQRLAASLALVDRVDWGQWPELVGCAYWLVRSPVTCQHSAVGQVPLTHIISLRRSRIFLTTWSMCVVLHQWCTASATSVSVWNLNEFVTISVACLFNTDLLYFCMSVWAVRMLFLCVFIVFVFLWFSYFVLDLTTDSLRATHVLLSWIKIDRLNCYSYIEMFLSLKRGYRHYKCISLWLCY